MSTYQYHEDGTSPENGEIFVFGSNEAGIHGAGAARHAALEFGAVYGNGFGFQGKSYAIPTKDWEIETLPMDEVASYIVNFLVDAGENPQMEFFMTRVGCGLAGFVDSEIAPLFLGAPTNINFPIDWKPYLEV